MEVTYVDHMGDDLRVVNAARVSFDKESYWEFKETEYAYSVNPYVPHRTREKVLSEQDQKLIKYLAKHNHFTPFTHVQITMREKVPIFVARQRFKHTVGFSYNEVSRRYVDSEPEFFKPDVWRKKAENKKQGSSDEAVQWSPGWMQDYIEFLRQAEDLYESMLSANIAPEQARMVLPQSMYTEYYVTGSLAAWARAYKLRIDPHAQKEIQDLAKMWNDTINALPELEHSWEALTE